MCKKITILISIILLFLSPALFGQSIDIGVGGGLTIVQSPDGYTNEITNGGLDFTNEYHLGLKGKINLPLIPVTPYVLFNYYNFSGKADISGGGEQTTSQNILSFGGGIDYNLTPGPVPVKPYAALEVAYNNIGELELDPQPEVATTGESVSRFGLGVGLGVNFNLLPKVNLDASAKYHFLNLIGKEDGEDTISMINLDLLLFFTF